MGTSKATKDQYMTAVKHIGRAEKELGIELNLPWNVGQTLNYVGFLLEKRNCSSKTVGSHLSGIRMLHLCNGQDPKCLRPDMVNLVLKGQEHYEEARATLEQKPKRVAVSQYPGRTSKISGSGGWKRLPTISRSMEDGTAYRRWAVWHSELTGRGN